MQRAALLRLEARRQPGFKEGEAPEASRVREEVQWNGSGRGPRRGGVHDDVESGVGESFLDGVRGVRFGFVTGDQGRDVASDEMEW